MVVVSPGRGAALVEAPRSSYVYVVRSARTRALSIGVDLTPNGACPIACDYCQVPRAGARTRPGPVDLARLETELRAAVESTERAGDVAFAGSGEPTWSPDFVRALETARDVVRARRLPVRVMTSGLLLHREPIARALESLVTSGEGEAWVKLDAWDEPSWRRITRTRGIERHRARIAAFARRAPIVVQTLLARRRGDPPVDEIAEALARELAAMREAGALVDRVELTTLLRPPGEAGALAAVDSGDLDRVARALASTGLRVGVVSLDPALHPVVRLRVRRRELLDRAGSRDHALTVFCPLERRAMHLDMCRRCTYAHESAADVVTCAPPLPREPREAPTAPLGARSLVGDAMGVRVLSVRTNVSWGVAERALVHVGAIAALVVDADDRLVGVLDREHVTDMPARAAAGDLARPVAPVTESSPLAHAVARMVHERSRALPVVGDDGCVVGILSDVDALNWIARRRAG